MGWFTRKPAATDVVWMTEQAKIAAIHRVIAEASRPLLVIAFFEDSLRPFAGAVLARNVAPGFDASNGPDVCVVERHPLPVHNDRLLKMLQSVTKSVPVFHAAIDDPLFQRFGGERITALMNTLGMQPDEPISHPFVTKALANAREKLAKAIPFEQPATSMAEWFARNAPPK